MYLYLSEDFKQALKLNTEKVRAIDGATTNEAGGFLAWTDAVSSPVTTTYKMGNTTIESTDLVKGSYSAKKDDDTEASSFNYSYTDTKGTETTDDDVVYYAACYGSLPTNGTVTFYKVTESGGVKTVNTTSADNLTLTVTTSGGEAAILPGPVNSATNTDVAESVGENPIDNPGQVTTPVWHPEKTGAYVFRRSFVPKDDKGTEETTDDVAAYYTYAGYYYDASDGSYYKIVLGTDNFRASNDDAVENGTATNFVFDISATEAQIGADGTTNATCIVDPKTGEVTDGYVLYQFVKEEKVVDAVPTLTYHSTGDADHHNVAYLSAYYSDGTSDQSVDFLTKQAAYEQAASDAEAAYNDYLSAIGNEALTEAEYDNAVGAYNSAVSRYNQAKADYDYAVALYNASQKLIDAADTRGQAEVKKDDAKDAMNAALQAVKNEATGLKGTPDSTSITAPKATTATNYSSCFEDVLSFGKDTDISYKSIFQTTTVTVGEGASATDWSLEDIITDDDTALADGVVTNASVLTAAKTYMDQMKDLWSKTGDTGASGVEATTIVGAATRLKNALDAFANLGTGTSGDFAQDAQNDLDELYTLVSNEKESAYNNLVTLLNRYESLYTSLKGIARNEAQLTMLLDGSDTDTIAQKIDAWQDRLDAMETRIESNHDDTANIGKLEIADDGTVTLPAGVTDEYGIDALVQDYKIKYNNYVKEITVNIPAADKAWEAAVKTYEKEVSEYKYGDNADGAKKAYLDDIHTDQRVRDEQHDVIDANTGNVTTKAYQKNDYEGLVTTATENDADGNAKWWLTDDSKKINAIFAVERPQDNVSPSLGTTYVTIGTVSDNTITDDDITVTGPGKTLWKTIGSDLVAPGTLAMGKDNVTYSDTTNPSRNKTDEAKHTTHTLSGDSTTNSYTKAVIAKPVGTDAFKTFVQNTYLTGDAQYKTVDALYDLIKDGSDLKTAAEAKEAAYNDAVSDRKAKATAKDTAETLKNKAKTAAANAGEADSSAIVFNIYLDDQNDAGQLDWTSALGNGESAQVADFYYNYILEGGATSEKLIDAVELDKSVGTKDYKSLEFDLNVALDSVQVTYAENQRDVTAEAVTKDGFGKTATINSQTPTDKGIAVTWSPSDAADNTTNKTYRVGFDVVNPTPYTTGDIKKDIDGDSTDETMTWTFTLSGDTYYGTSNANGSTFYKYDTNSSDWPTTDVTVILNEVN